MTRLWIFIAVLLAVAFASERLAVVQHAKAQGSFPSVALQRAQTDHDAIDEAPPSLNAEERAKREAKNRRYNGRERDLTTMAPDTELVGVACGAEMPLLPTAYTSVIVIGTVIGIQPYLSEDHSEVYTEYTLQIEEFLKKDVGKLPMTGERLIVDRIGGALLRLRNGQVIHYDFSASSMARPLHAGERCILFLDRIHDGADLLLGPGFLLRNGQAYALGEYEGHVGGLQDVPKELSQEAEFLKAVRRAIENPPSQHFYSALDIK